MTIHKVAFIGLGLLGGSLAKQIREKHPSIIISATTHSQKTVALALSEGTIDAAGEIAFVVEDADVVFIASPLELIPEHIRQVYVETKPEAIIVDIGSTKTVICNQAKKYASKFIGGHPMAGTEKTGYVNSFAGLLAQARFVLTPYAQTPKKKLKLLTQFLKELDMRVIMMTPEKHDAAVAAISHVPYFTAVALASLADTTEKKALAATGFQSSTRVASSDPAWGVGVSQSNTVAIVKDLKRLQKELAKMTTLIEKGKSKDLSKLLAERRKRRAEIYPQ